MRGLLLGLVNVAAIALVGATLWFGLRAFAGADPPALVNRPGASATAGTPAVRSGTLPPVRLATPDATRVAAATAGPDALLGVLSEATLNDVLRGGLATFQGEVTIERASLRLRPGQMELTGQVRGLVPFAVDFRVVGRPVMRDGQPRLAIDRVEGIGLPLPDTAARRLEAVLGELALARLPTDLGVTGVVAGDGELLVYGPRSRPVASPTAGR